MKFEIGKKINKWTIVSDEIIVNEIKGHTLKCECGNEEFRSSSILHTNETIIKQCRCCGQLKRVDRIYYVGLVLQNLTILKVIPTIKNIRPISYLVKCTCGNIYTCGHPTLNIKSGKSKRRTSLPCCEKCFTSDMKQPKKNNMLTKDISSTIFGAIKRSAGRRGIEFSVTPEYLQELYENQNYKCIYSDLELNITESIKKKENRILNTASLDRIDSNLGYIVGNVQWVHKDVNLIKHTFNHDEFIKIISLIANRF